MKSCPACGEAYPQDVSFCPNDGRPLREHLDPLVGKTLAQRYRLIQRLGAGGMASVYLARHVMIDRLSAIKILRPELCRSEEARDRFLREARAVNRINHDAIVEVSDCGESEGLVYLVMEYVPGESLEKQLERGPLEWRRVLAIGVQIASALARAHQVGVIHRDLKPDNVLLVRRRDGREGAKITDFGIAKILDAPSLTFGDRVFGTPGYIAPEYLQGKNPDARTDLYSLGVVLYRAACGALPFDGTSHAELLMQAVSSAPAPIEGRVSDLPPSLGHAIMRLVSPRPEDRPKDAFHLLDDLVGIAAETGVVVGVDDAVREPAPTPAARADSPPSDAPTDRRPAAAGDSAEPTRRAPADPAAGVAGTGAPSERPFADIEPACRAALDRVERAVERYRSLGPRAIDLVQRTRAVVAAVAHAAAAVVEDQVRIADVEAAAAETRAGIGADLDRLGHERSREGDDIEALAARIADVERRRAATSGEAADTLLWEKAALEQSAGDAARAVEDIDARIATLREQIDLESEAADERLAEARGALEGHVAALRRLGAEAAVTAAEAARELGVDSVRHARPGA